MEVPPRPSCAAALRHPLIPGLAGRWGGHEVQGLDPSRAEALALSPTQHQVGYTIRSAEQLPPALAHAGASARLVRRTAELMLRHSIVYASIEERRAALTRSPATTAGEGALPHPSPCFQVQVDAGVLCRGAAHRTDAV